MKIALLGNMNNNNYVLLRYLRDNDLEADLLLFDDELKHFSPSQDSFNKQDFNHIKQLLWGSIYNILIPKEKIINDLKNYDIIIGTGLAPAYAYRANIQVDIFIPYGSDIFYFTEYKLTYPSKIIKLWISVFFQKKGLKKCKIWQFPITNHIGEKKWNIYRGNAKRWIFPFPNIYDDKNYKIDKISQYFAGSDLNKLVKKIKKTNDLVLISPTRHYSSNNKNETNNKNTNKLIKGLHLFKKKNPRIKFNLITFNYGPHFKKSLKLIKQYKLEDNITIKNLSSRKEVIYLMLHSDIVCGEFNLTWLSGGVIFESLLTEKILLTYRNDEYYKKHYNSLYPILNAKEPLEIANKIQIYYGNKKKFDFLAKKANLWYKEHVVEKTLKAFKDFLKKSGYAKK